MNYSVTLDEIRSFIHNHTLTNWPSEEILFDILVDDPDAFLKLVCESDYYVRGMTWFDHSPITIGSELGPTGPLDPRDPLYAYFITYLDDKFSPDTTLDEYLSYMIDIRQSYPLHDLCPGFHLSPREEKTSN